ncbi:hypothetical protein FQN60_009362 [Etheostoma spectabile]|uniref:Uncharacterized protein n=1 Tax=Etheostoma spectabile TaxID=54343 RepID=A0A5J5DIP0_9PERO|nr:hypothetical protein FQN60_009362 [Etheostoma spectabile]
MVTPPSSLLSSSSLRTASCRWRGMIRVFLLSRAAFPASSRISAVSTPAQPPGRRGRRLPRAERSSPYGAACEHGRPGTGARHERSGSSP